MKTQFYCEHCNKFEHGTVIDTKYVVNQVFQLTIKCFICNKVTVETTSLEENKRVMSGNLVHRVGCHSRWMERQAGSK